MSKLTALGTTFLLVESQETPGHVGMVQMFQLPRGKGPAWLGSVNRSLDDN